MIAANFIDISTTIEEIIKSCEKVLSQLAELIKQDVQTIPEENVVRALCAANSEKILRTKLMD